MANTLYGGLIQELPVQGFRITSPVGVRDAKQTTNGKRMSHVHMGTDFGTPLNTPFASATDGQVVFAGNRSGYGNQVIVKSPTGVLTAYSHLSNIGVKQGQSVAAGQTLGKTGATGNVTGPHLDFRVWKDGMSYDASGNPFRPFSLAGVSDKAGPAGSGAAGAMAGGAVVAPVAVVAMPKAAYAEAYTADQNPFAPTGGTEAKIPDPFINVRIPANVTEQIDQMYKIS